MQNILRISLLLLLVYMTTSLNNNNLKLNHKPFNITCNYQLRKFNKDLEINLINLLRDPQIYLNFFIFYLSYKKND